MEALLWQEKALSLLDQRKFPQEELWIDCPDYRKVVELFQTPKLVEGEAILACAGAYAYCLAAMEFVDSPEFFKNLTAAKQALLDSRPECTALATAMQRMDKVFEEYRNNPEQITALLATAVTIHRQDVVACRAMGREGRELLPEEAKLVVSCRGGIFHTGALGGALGVLRSATLRQSIGQVYLCENRPGMEGVNYAAHELLRHKIPTTVIPDHAAASLMPRRCCDLVLLEGLQVAANGDVLAGPGTYELAIAAYFHSIPVYATAYTKDINVALPTGEAFPEKEKETTFAVPSLPDGVETWAPAYDVLPQYLLTGIITEKGMLFQSFEETIPELLSKTEDKPVLFL